MKTKTMKKLLFLLLCVCLACSTLLLTACRDKNPGGGGDGGGGGGGTTVTPGGGGATDTPGDADPIWATVVYSGEQTTRWEIKNGTLVGFTAPVNPGYKYLGVYDAPVGGSLVIDAQGHYNFVLEKEITLYVHWEPLSYELTFTTTVGRMEAKDEHTTLYAGQTMPNPLPTPLYDANQYEFVGWELMCDGEAVLISRGAQPLSNFETFSYIPALSDADRALELVAKFKPAELKVTFDYNDGSYNFLEYDVTYGDMFDFEFPTLTGINREVLHWSTTPSGQDPYYPDIITGNLTLYAVWIDYKIVEFHISDTHVIEQKYYKGNPISIDDPLREGYDFDGWYTSQTFAGNPVQSFTYGALAKKYFAKWTPIPYEVSLYNGQTLVKTYEYTVEDEVLFPTDLTLKGHTFKGWRDKDGNYYTKKVLGDVITDTLYAEFEPNRYTVTYTDGETVITTEPVEYGTSFTPKQPQKRGYTFVGFTLDGQAYDGGEFLFTEDITLDAQFTINTYTITYVQDGKTIQTDNVEFGAAFELLTPEKRGYTFVGFTWEGAAFDAEVYDFTEDLTLVAQFEVNTYTITYMQDGEVLTTVDIDYGTTIEHVVPEKLGYRFTGFTLEGAAFEDEVYDYIEDITLVAQFDIVVYRVDYELYGATNDGANIKEYTVHDTFLFRDAEKEHYLFEGWFLDADYTQPYTEIAVGTVGDIKLYARFTGMNYAALLDSGEGVCQRDKIVVEYGAPFFIPVCTREGYSFDGWFSEPNGGGVRLTDADGNSVGDWSFGALETTIYASYIKRYYININNNYPAAATIELKEFYLVGEKVTLEVKYDDGYTFQGFYDEAGKAISYTPKYTFVMPDADVDLTITFAPRIFTVNLDASGAYCDLTFVNVDYGQPFALPEAFLDGKQFVGWKVGDTFITGTDGVGKEPYFFKENVTAVAQFIDSADSSKLIYTYDDLVLMLTNPAGNYVLLADIDLTGRTWTSIDFTGTLDGLGHKISGLSVPLFNSTNGVVKNLTVKMQGTFENIDAERKTMAIFALTIKGGKVENVTVEGSISVSGRYAVGALAYQLSGGEVIGCCNKATITSRNEHNGDYIGGLIAYMTGGSLKESENRGHVEGVYHVGGLVGYVTGGTYRQCTNYGTVIGVTDVGGFAGHVQYAGNIVMESLYIKNVGDVTGVTNVGGVFGNFRNERSDHYNDFSTKLTYIFNEGTVTGETYVGGIMGYSYHNNADRYSIYCYYVSFNNTGDICGISYVGGLIGYAYADGGASYVTKSSSKNCTVSATYMVGGLAGQLQNLALSDSSNEGMTVKATGAHSDSTTYTAWLGGYVGYASAVSGCDNASDIVYESNGRFVGGIVGRADGAVVDCSNSGHITAPAAAYVGGIGGYVLVSGNVTINLDSNTGDIVGDSYVGGLFGKLEDSRSDHYSDFTLTIKELSNSGKISSTGGYAGGIAGDIYCNNADRYGVCLVASLLTNTGDITGHSYVGGLVGHVYADLGSGYITASESTDSTVTAEYMVGGLAGSLENVAMNSCSNEGMTIIATSSLLEGTVYNVYLGGYVGYSASISDCHNASAIVYEHGGRFVGGIVGRAGGVVTACTNTAAITAPTSDFVGGIGGYVVCSGNVTISGASNEGAITGKGYVGGLFGKLEDSRSDHYSDFTLTIKELSNSGIVTATDSYAGGIAGEISCHNDDRYGINLVATVLTNTGNIQGKSHVGGLVGHVYADRSGYINVSSSTNCSVSAEYMVGGLAGYLESTSMSDCSNEGMTVTATGSQMDGTVYNAYLGGYVGRGTSISGCDNAVELMYTHGGRFVGGIIGYATGAVNDCNNTANITAADSEYVGGLVGHANVYGNVTIANLTNSGNIKGKIRVGGLFGNLEDNTSDHYNNHTLTLSQLTNTGAVTAEGNYAGGIAGRIYGNNADTMSVYIVATVLTNRGTITSGGSHVGGIAGYVDADVVGGGFTTVENYAVITGMSNIGGLFGSIYDVSVTKGYNYAEAVVCIDPDAPSCIGGAIGATSSHLNAIENAATVYCPNGTYVGGVVGHYSVGADYTVQNLKNTAAVTGKEHVGGLIGYLASSCSDHYADHAMNILTSTNEGEVTGDAYTGGIIGYLTVNNGDRYSMIAYLTDCTNTADVTGTHHVGGIVGYATADGRVAMNRCSSTNVTLTGEYYVGGLVGQGNNTDITDSKNDGTTIVANGSFLNGTVYEAFIGGFAGSCRSLSNLTNHVQINYTGMGRYVGGFAGYMNGSINNCTNHADVSASNADYVGGITGFLASPGPVTAATNTGDITGVNYVAGLVGKLTYTSGDHYNNLTANLSQDTNNGTITATGDCVGGLFGEYYINNSDRYGYLLVATTLTNTGAVSGGKNVGGYIGLFYSDGGSSIKLSEATGTVTGTESYGDCVGAQSNLTIS